MNLKFTYTLTPNTTVEIEGEEIHWGKKLYIGGVDDDSVLTQLWDQYSDDGEMKDVKSALLLAARLRGGAFSDLTANQFLGHMVVIADMLLSSSDVVEPKVRADLEKIKSIGTVTAQPAA